MSPSERGKSNARLASASNRQSGVMPVAGALVRDCLWNEVVRKMSGRIEELELRNEVLEAENKDCQKKIRAKSKQVGILKKIVRDLTRKLDDAQRALYGSTADRTSELADLDCGGNGEDGSDGGGRQPLDSELRKFDYASHEDVGRKRRGRSAEPPEHLSQQTKSIDPSDVCPDCGCAECAAMGGDASWVVEMVPVPFFIQWTKRGKVQCARCRKIRQSRVPPRVFPRGQLGNSLVSKLAVDKTLFGLPIGRLHKQLSYSGISIAERTLNNYFNKCGVVLESLHQLLRQDLLACGELYGDDSHHAIKLKERKGRLTRGHAWHYVGYDRPTGGTGPIIVYIDVTSDWKSDHAREFLKNYRGVLHTDAYLGWLSIFAESEGRFILQLCWAHARRKFVNVLREKSGATRAQVKIARKALKLMRQLFKVERRAFGLDAASRLEMRKKESTLLAKDLEELLKENRAKLDDGNVLAKAMDYMIGKWDMFAAFLSHGEASMTTNPVEREIRTFAVCRKNFGYSETLEAAKSLAVIMSLVKTCTLNGVNPYEWLHDVLNRLPNADEKELHALLPYNWAKKTEQNADAEDVARGRSVNQSDAGPNAVGKPQPVNSHSRNNPGQHPLKDQSRKTTATDSDHAGDSTSTPDGETASRQSRNRSAGTKSALKPNNAARSDNRTGKPDEKTAPAATGNRKLNVRLPVGVEDLHHTDKTLMPNRPQSHQEISNRSAISNSCRPGSNERDVHSDESGSIPLETRRTNNPNSYRPARAPPGSA